MNGDKKMGGGNTAGRNTARMGRFSTHETTRLWILAETNFRIATSPPFWPSFQEVNPPTMLPEIAHKARNQGLPLCETSHNSSKSVLPGIGNGKGEESTIATANSPSGPSCRSHTGTGV